MALFKSIFRALFNLIYPLSCQVCKNPLDPENDRYLCEACWEKIQRNPPPFCTKCGRSLPGVAAPGNGGPTSIEARGQASVCGSCQTAEYFFERAGAPCLYDGVIKECIHLLKYGKRLRLVSPLGGLLVDFINSHFNLEGVELIVPVPLHSVRLREREFNQAELLARQIEAATKIPVLTGNLRKIRPRPPQTTLSREERLANLKGAFQVMRPSKFHQKYILLVDDVFTTGSTANECSKVMNNAGAKRVDVLTLARGA